MTNRIYACIDLKSFYASVECVERNLNPLTTNLVVADSSRTTKTICLAVSPSLKSFGIPGRPRLFEVVKKVNDINYERLKGAKRHHFTAKSYNLIDLSNNLNLELDYIIAPPRMAHYIKYSTKIFNIYLKYIAPEDIHVYSIDEVFIDLTHYLKYSGLSAHDFVMRMIKDVLKETGITATGGIGTNMYLAKVAMDIVAKHIKADKDGVRIAELDEYSYREKLWNHRPITDFWRVGKGYAKRLEEYGLYTMGDIALVSLNKFNKKYNEEMLYKMFGVNAELLIDHAWGYESATIKDIKSYKPENKSIGSGQVLHCAYTYKQTLLVIKEMADSLSLNLVEKHLVTDQIVLTINYDIENLTNVDLRNNYKGEIKEDAYGRKVPKQAHGSIMLKNKTSSSKIIVENAIALFSRIVNHNLLIRKINIVANRVIDENKVKEINCVEQFNLFQDSEVQDQKLKEEKAFLEKERKMQEALISIKNKYGKNAILKGMNLEEGATTKERNNQIGGHKA